MGNHEAMTTHISGTFRDVLWDAEGRTILDTGWRRNKIIVDCRRLLATFMRGTPAAIGIRGLQVGAGLAAWDAAAPPAPDVNQAALVDPSPYEKSSAALLMDYLDPGTGDIVSAPTNVLQIRAIFGPNQPSWPDGSHAAATLREFALVGELDGQTVLVNSVRHQAILKDPLSTLERTIQLIF